MVEDRLGELLAPFRAAPARSAVLLDVDGTLAPITQSPEDTIVPEATRKELRAVAARFARVGCVSGRRAVQARRIVGLDELDYVGNHGVEVLRAGAAAVEVRPEVAEWEPRVRRIALELLDGESPLGQEIAALQIRLEDKGPIQALHWRGSPDEDAAAELVTRLGHAAEAAGLTLHRGRMVLELRPPVRFSKGAAAGWLLNGDGLQNALYAGDDQTDLDAFAGLRALQGAGGLARTVCVAVVDEESPPAVAAAADITVAGTDGVQALLRELVRP